MGCDWKCAAKVIAIIDTIYCSLCVIEWLLIVADVDFVKVEGVHRYPGGGAWAILFFWILFLILAILLLMATMDKFDKKKCFIICIVWIVMNSLWTFWWCYDAFRAGFAYGGFITVLLHALFIGLVVPFTIECSK